MPVKKQKRSKKIKKAIVLQGSPRFKKGNTATVLEFFNRALQAKGFSIKQYNLYSLDFRGCAHCDQCRTILNKPQCVLSDDFSSILDHIHDADLIVLASPIYCWSFSGCASAALDRLYAFFKQEHPNLLQNKQIAGVFTAAGNEEGGLDLCVEGLRRLSEYAGAYYIGSVGITECTTPNELKKPASAKKVKSAIHQVTKKLKK